MSGKLAFSASVSIVFVLAILTPSGRNAFGQPQQRENQLELEQQKFEFDKEMEIRKHALEKSKAILTAGSIALPLIFGLYSINRQIKLARSEREIEARNSFELKAADLLLNSKTPGQLHAKAKALMKLFPNAPLPTGFADSVKSFDPAEFAGPGTDWKIELFRLLAAPNANKQEVIKLWRQLFPGDTWIDRLNEEPKVSS
jgi:hypothetical protein